MRNVVINRIARYVFTESQLRSYWQRLGNDLDFYSLTNEQLMKLANSMYHDSSPSELEQHVLGKGWRSPDEVEGKMVAEDDSQNDVHIEIIDTSQDGSITQILIDRVLQLACKSCSFKFYVDNIDLDLKNVNCPTCFGDVEAVREKRVITRSS